MSTWAAKVQGLESVQNPMETWPFGWPALKRATKLLLGRKPTPLKAPVVATFMMVPSLAQPRPSSAPIHVYPDVADPAPLVRVSINDQKLVDYLTEHGSTPTF